MSIDFEKGGGLIPAVVQDAANGAVLMVGFMNAEALDETRRTGLVTFYSRTKKRLWTKGETSENFLRVKEILEDCDSDAVLVLADPQGPVCHTGSRTCFGDGYSFKQPLSFLDELASVIHGRRQVPSGQSYTAHLLERGARLIAQKVGEEAVELAIEAAAGEDKRMISEAADLLYHLMVLLESRELSLADVVRELEKRHEGA